MRISILFLSAALLVGLSALPAHAQRGGGRGGWGGGGFGGGFGGHGAFGYDRWGYGFDRWGYGFGPYAWAGLYGYPYGAYAGFYYPPSIYYVPPTYGTVVEPVVSYFPVPVPVAVPPPTPTYYSPYVGAVPASQRPPATSAPAGFAANTAPQPSYPGYTARPSTSSSGSYPDAP